MTPEDDIPRCGTCDQPLEPGDITVLEKVRICRHCLPLVMALMESPCMEEIAS